MSQLSNIDRAERVALGRARVLPAIGTMFIVLNAVFSGSAPVTWLGRSIWVAVFLLGFALILTGGVWPGRLRKLIEDETTRAFRSQALSVGYYATFACLLGTLITSFFMSLPTTQVLQIALATSVAAPMIAFGVMERHALGHG